MSASVSISALSDSSVNNISILKSENAILSPVSHTATEY